MPSKRETDRSTARQRILRQSLLMLSHSGFRGVTFGTLATNLGVSKSGLFSHFKSIDHLHLDTLRLAHRHWYNHTIALIPSRSTWTLESYFFLWLGWSEEAGLSKRCPVTQAMFTLPALSEQLQVEVRRIATEWQQTLVKLIDESVSNHQLMKGISVPNTVSELQSIYINHQMMVTMAAANARSEAERAFETLKFRIKPPDAPSKVTTSSPK